MMKQELQRVILPIFVSNCTVVEQFDLLFKSLALSILSKGSIILTEYKVKTKLTVLTYRTLCFAEAPADDCSYV